MCPVTRAVNAVVSENRAMAEIENKMVRCKTRLAKVRLTETIAFSHASLVVAQ